jgi:hypothetical protein
MGLKFRVEGPNISEGLAIQHRKVLVLDGSSQITESTALATQIHVLLQSFCVLLIHRTKGWFKSLRQGVKGPNISIALAITLEIL